MMSSSAHRIKINVLHYLRLLQKQLSYSLLASMSFVLRTVEERLCLKSEMLKTFEDVVALVVVDAFLQRVLLASLLALTMDDASRHRLEILLYYYFDGAVVDGEDNESVAADDVVS